MKVVNKTTIDLGGNVYSRTQLENALRMLDNYQPPAPEFQAGDIVEPINGGYSENKLVVLGGAIANDLASIHAGKDTLRFTDGSHSWSGQNPRNFRKIGSLGSL